MLKGTSARSALFDFCELTTQHLLVQAPTPLELLILTPKITSSAEVQN